MSSDDISRHFRFVVVRDYQYPGEFMLGFWVEHKRWYQLTDGDCYRLKELLTDEFDAEFLTDSEVESMLRDVEKHE